VELASVVGAKTVDVVAVFDAEELECAGDGVGGVVGQHVDECGTSEDADEEHEAGESRDQVADDAGLDGLDVCREEVADEVSLDGLSLLGHFAHRAEFAAVAWGQVVGHLDVLVLCPFAHA